MMHPAAPRGALVSLLLALLLLALPACAETRWKVVASYPHDTRAFTEGLIFLDGSLYESTGLYGRSEIREVELATGKVLRSARVPDIYFGEGLTHWDGDLISLTWKRGTGFRWDRATFLQTGAFGYSGEGWGLTQDGRHLIMSDGTDQLRFLDPEDFSEIRRIAVTWGGRPVRLVNELEYVKGEILANVWMTDRIARINPGTGRIIDWIDLSPLVRKLALSDYDAVLNGIAYDAEADRLFVTGKYWPKLYEIRLEH